MYRSQRIRKIIPHLRQFGLMLTGRLSLTDQAIATCLQQLANDWQKLNQPSDVRIDLYQKFLAVVGQQEFSLGDTDILSAFSSREQRAFLLVHVQEFTRYEAAVILGMSVGELLMLERQMSLTTGTRPDLADTISLSDRNKQLAH